MCSMNETGEKAKGAVDIDLTRLESQSVELPTILHADLDAFYASVEQRDNPELRGIPVIVGAGVVLASSYEARAMGVRTAMSGREARKRCPQAIVVSPRMAAYSQASKDVFEIFHDISPTVEGLSIDEAFIDVTGLRRLVGPARGIAENLRRRVKQEVGLDISVGVASTKFLAKVASGVCKPDGLLVVEAGREVEFLHPLPVGKLWGVGPVTDRKLRDRGVKTVAEVAALSKDQLVAMLGRGSGQHLHALAHNRDPRRVDTGRRRRSIGSQRSFPGGGVDRQEAEAILLEVTDRVTYRMRSGHRVGKTITLRLRFGDFSQATRSMTVNQATSETAVVLAAGRALLSGAWPTIRERGLTKVGIAVSGLSDDSVIQLALPLDGKDTIQLDAAMDKVRDRFGRSSIGLTTLTNRPKLEVPLLDV